MDLKKAYRLTYHLMHKYNLLQQGWVIKWDESNRRAGWCSSFKKEIGLSKKVTAYHSEEEVRDTILHEIAHALVGTKEGHGPVWKRKAIEIGCNGQRCYTNRPPGKYKGTCPAGHITYRDRKPGEHSCGRCSRSFNREYLITWEINNQ